MTARHLLALRSGTVEIDGNPHTGSRPVPRTSETKLMIEGGRLFWRPQKLRHLRYATPQ